MVGDGERGAVKKVSGKDGCAHAGGGVVVVGRRGWIWNADAGQFDGEREEGAEIRGDGGWGGSTREGMEKGRANGSVWRKVFCRIRH